MDAHDGGRDSTAVPAAAQDPCAAPSAAHALIGHSCVNDCIFCAVADLRRDRRPQPAAEIVGFMQRSAAAGVPRAVFSGLGEPTLDPHLERYIDVAKDLRFKEVWLFTNGHRLDADRAQRFAALGLTHALVSVHGTEGSHDENVRRRGAFVEARRALDHLLDAGVEIAVNTCLTRHNIDDIPSLLGLLATRPVNYVSLSFPEWSGNVLRHVDEMISYGDVEVRAEAWLAQRAPPLLFANIPPCFLPRHARSVSCRHEVRVLDGDGAHNLRCSPLNILPTQCGIRCPDALACPGLDVHYLDPRLRGAPRPEERAARDSAPEPEAVGPAASTPTGPRNLTLIVKPTLRCNAACEYCASRPAERGVDMTEATQDLLRARLRQLLGENGRRRVTVLWHGGEPLLAGKDYFRRFWSDESIAPPRVNHLLQTNLLALDEEWVTLLREHGIEVSTSCDPFATSRRLGNGEPQWPRWIDRFLLAARAGIPLGIVFTVTQEHMARADEIYALFRHLGRFCSRPMPVRLNSVHLVAGGPPVKVATPEAVGRFLGRIAALWERDERPFPLAPIDHWTGCGAPSCEFAGTCQDTFLALDPDGEAYLCGRYLDSRRRPIGHLAANALEELVERGRPERRALRERMDRLQLDGCGACAHWSICHGGCPCLAEDTPTDARIAQCGVVQAFFADRSAS